MAALLKQVRFVFYILLGICYFHYGEKFIVILQNHASDVFNVTIFTILQIFTFPEIVEDDEKSDSTRNEMIKTEPDDDYNNQSTYISGVMFENYRGV